MRFPESNPPIKIQKNKDFKEIISLIKSQKMVNLKSQKEFKKDEICRIKSPQNKDFNMIFLGSKSPQQILQYSFAIHFSIFIFLKIENAFGFPFYAGKWKIFFFQRKTEGGIIQGRIQLLLLCWPQQETQR